MKKKYNQLCVWEGTVVGKENINDLIRWLKNTFDVRGKYAEEVLTLPTPGEKGTGGRNDLFFFIHDDDIQKFSVPRFQYGIRWWEDVLGNGNDVLYSEEVLNKYPKTW